MVLSYKLRFRPFVDPSGWGMPNLGEASGGSNSPQKTWDGFHMAYAAYAKEIPLKSQSTDWQISFAFGFIPDVFGAFTQDSDLNGVSWRIQSGLGAPRIAMWSMSSLTSHQVSQNALQTNAKAEKELCGFWIWKIRAEHRSCRQCMRLFVSGVLDTCVPWAGFWWTTSRFRLSLDLGKFLATTPPLGGFRLQASDKWQSDHRLIRKHCFSWTVSAFACTVDTVGRSPAYMPP